jgi:hypothetical protein
VEVLLTVAHRWLDTVSVESRQTIVHIDMYLMKSIYDYDYDSYYFCLTESKSSGIFHVQKLEVSMNDCYKTILLYIGIDEVTPYHHVVKLEVYDC